MIVPMSKARLATLLAVLVAAPVVNAHGGMSVPKPTYAIQGDTTQFGLTVDSSALTAPAGKSFTTDPESNTNAFTAALKASTYKSVKDLVAAKGVPIAGANKECGLTTATGAKQPLPEKFVEWSHGSGEGFTPSHQGPCEVWCDNVLAFSDDNCAKNYPTAPAKLPFDRTKCVGKSVLKTIWLALHSPTWQAYINCAALEGGSGAASPATPASPAATSSPATSRAPATTAPASGGDEYDDEYATPAPAAGGADDEDCDDELEIPDTPAPASGGADDEDCDDELEIPDTPAPASGGEVGGDADTGAADDEDCDPLDLAGSEEDCEDDLDIADTPAPAATPTKTKKTKTPKPTKTKKTKTPKPTKTKKAEQRSLDFDTLDENYEAATVDAY